MPRTARQMPPGAIYHLTARGTNKRPIFADDTDCHRFLAYLAAATERYELSSLAYCLMGNHVHLVLSGDPHAISAGMRDVLGAHARSYNRRAGRSGHLFGERFHHVTVAQHDQMVATIRYVALNPVRAGLVRRPEDWPWSSYSAIATGKASVGAIDIAALVPLFAGPGAGTRAATRELQRIVEAGVADAITLADRRPRRKSAATGDSHRGRVVTVTGGGG